MATHIRESITLPLLADICDSITGALEADPKTAHLSTTWADFLSRTDKLSDEQKQLTRQTSRIRTKLSVQDAIWDPEIAAFGRAVVDASNGKRDIPPYTRFFKEFPPSEVQKLSPEKEVQFGEKWVTELNRDPNEPLAINWISRLTVVTSALSQVLRERESIENQLSTLDTSRRLLLREINLALDIVEGDIQRIFPGDSKRVASYLTATKPSTPTPRVTEATPETQP